MHSATHHWANTLRARSSNRLSCHALARKRPIAPGQSIEIFSPNPTGNGGSVGSGPQNSPGSQTTLVKIWLISRNSAPWGKTKCRPAKTSRTDAGGNKEAVAPSNKLKKRIGPFLGRELLGPCESGKKRIGSEGSSGGSFSHIEQHILEVSVICKQRQAALLGQQNRINGRIEVLDRI